MNHSRSQKFHSLLAGWMLLSAAASFASAAPPTDKPNLLFKQLLDEGAKLGESTVRLPAPTWPDGLSAEEAQQRFAEIADDNHPLEALLRQSVVAPFVLRIKDEPDAGKVRPRRVDLWFVAYGDFARLGEDGFLTHEVEAANASDGARASTKGGILTDDELKDRGITPDADERFLAANFTLFDRVSVSGTMRAVLTQSADSIVLAAITDPRFAKDATFSNSWRTIQRDPAGQLTTGAAQPYSGGAWYCKATRLAKPARAVAVEYHLIFDEPVAWFNGANLLRSKLPLVVQDGVRKFRRRFAAPATGAAN
jgi:hypothetical protein